MATPQSKTPSTDTLNPSTTPTTVAETTQQPTSGNPPPKSPESSVKRKREEEDVESESDDLKKPKPASLHPLHKTSLCSYFRSNSGSCSHGEECRFAHNEEELRPRPDGSWDPTSLRVKRKESEEKRDAEDDEGDVEEERSAMMTEVLGDSGDPQLSKCLIHLPRKWTSDQLKTYLDEQGVVFKLAKKKKGMSVGFLTFEAAEQVKSATELLGGKSIGKEKLKIGDVIPRSYDEKIKSAQKRYQSGMPGVADETEATLASNGTEDGEGNSSTSRVKSVRDAVTPLAHLSYAEQLEQKKNSLTQMLKKLTRNARKACPKDLQLPEWVVKSREIGGLPCKLEGIIESPLINGYRNKCEFSVGLSVQGKPTVGFMLGNFREGVTAVEEPTNCLNVSKIACNYASVFQEFLRDSALPIWNRFNNSGFWRQLTVREGRNPQKNVELEIENHEANITEVMLIVQVSTEGCDDDLVNSELEKLTQAFVNGAASTSPPLPLTVLALQDHKGISNVAPADAPLRPLPIHTAQSGSETEVIMATNESRIHDYIGNLRFSISPTAFFQVNTLAAEKLYSLAGDWAGLGPDTLLFDVCCGTGTIGLTLANRVGMVVGIEMNASAVSDAQRNAEINAITNCKFICAKAEDVMGSLLREYLDDTSNPLDGDEKENGAAESQSVSLNEADPEDCSNEVNVDTNHACGSDKGEQDLQSNLKDSNTKDGSALKQHFKNVVAIVDPPRSGLHPVVLKALRTHPCLKRLVYISCNPETLVANAIELCTPSSEIAEKGRKGQGWRNMSNAGLARHRLKSMPKSEPFQPVKAMAVDLFPHTPHCELVMLLER
ncbi:zinc finger CCCH domain-containing protein 24-like [Chenopodium quinoa]|uniref:zinc finger CCCH domain-containing protein 24-like n=1 Tax=Chenopodium quinoa TaxID=63459 RepID=UPI000B77686F|nr:zinc finger CCCH domain-containing protein 24-like [Chenopodium quinoa]